MLNIFPQTLCSGDTYPLKLSFKDPNTGGAFDMTGSTVGVTVKSLPGDTEEGQPDSDAEFKQDLTGDTTGVFNFQIGPLEAGDHWLDVKVWQTTGGARSTVIPPVQLHIIQSVTSR